LSAYGYPYPNGTPYAGDEYAYHSAVEFMSPKDLQNNNDIFWISRPTAYEVVKIIIYDN